jgi:flagellar biosynthesis protein FliP
MRKLSALLIAISLFLPLQSCTTDGKTNVSYPLSGDATTVALMAVIYLLPLIVFFLPKYPRVSISIGSLACAAGLYFVTFASSILATRLLAGWYIYSASSIAYIVVSLTEFGRILAANQLLKRTTLGRPAA